MHLVVKIVNGLADDWPVGEVYLVPTDAAVAGDECRAAVATAVASGYAIGPDWLVARRLAYNQLSGRPEHNVAVATGVPVGAMDSGDVAAAHRLLRRVLEGLGPSVDLTGHNTDSGVVLLDGLIEFHAGLLLLARPRPARPGVWRRLLARLTALFR